MDRLNATEQTASGWTASLERLLGNDTARILIAGAAADADTRAERAANRERIDRLARQANLERVMEQAAEALTGKTERRALPAGWLAAFLTAAEVAFEETDQALWGRLLAAATVDPDAAPRRYLARIAELDGWELEAFANFCPFAFSFESGGRLLFVDDWAVREFWLYGRERDLSAHFADLGLLSDQVETLRLGRSRGLRIQYFGQAYQLDAGEQGQEIGDATVSYRPFTPLGRRLAECLTVKPLFGFARNLVGAFNREMPVRLNSVEESAPVNS